MRTAACQNAYSGNRNTYPNVIVSPFTDNIVPTHGAINSALRSEFIATPQIGIMLGAAIRDRDSAGVRAVGASGNRRPLAQSIAAPSVHMPGPGRRFPG